MDSKSRRSSAVERGKQTPKIRELFTREALLKSDWYAERLKCQQDKDIYQWQKNVAYLEHFLERDTHSAVAKRLGIEARLTEAKDTLETVRSKQYLNSLVGTIGRQPISL